MDSKLPSSKNHFLLLQHRPVIAPIVWQASASLNFSLSIANNSGQFFRHYQESLLNPFRMFGSTPIHGIMLDLVHATNKTLDVLSELRARYSSLPPVIGLYQSNNPMQADSLLEKGFDELIDFPGKDNALHAKLSHFLGEKTRSGLLPKDEDLNDQFDNLPVVNLRTYGLFKEFAFLQDFSLEQLFNSFFEEMESFLLDLIRQYEAGNYPVCKRLTTSIRSLSGTLGASQMAQTSRYMEFCLKTGKPEEMGSWIPYLIEQFMVLRDYFELQPASLKEASLLN